MNRLLITVLVLKSTLTLSQVASIPAFHVGIKSFQYTDAERNRTIDTRVWYPVDTSVVMKNLFDGPVFNPVVATEGPAIVRTPKAFPLVLLSHGSGGLGVRLSWLAEYLVGEGYIVVTLDHPGNRAGDNSPDGLMKVWERPRDVSLILTKVLKESEFSDRIDMKRIGAVGHSAGGTTVLLLAGGRLKKKRLTNPIPGCAGTDPYFLKLCEGMKTLDLSKYLKKDVERSYRDERIRAVVSLDPGFGPSFIPSTFKDSRSRILVLAASDLHDPAEELSVSVLEGLLPQGSYEKLKNVNHFTFVTACKPGAERKIPEVADVCWKSAERANLQRQMGRKIAEFFGAARG